MTHKDQIKILDDKIKSATIPFRKNFDESLINDIKDDS